MHWYSVSCTINIGIPTYTREQPKSQEEIPGAHFPKFDIRHIEMKFRYEDEIRLASVNMNGLQRHRGYLLFSVKDRNLFHRVDTIGNIFTSGEATSENITDGVHQICLFHAFNPFWEKLYQNPVQFFSVIPRGVPLPHSNVLRYYVKRVKCKLNDVIFPSGC